MFLNKAILFADGGIGKVISSTAVARALSKVYDEVIVFSGYPDVFKHNQNCIGLHASKYDYELYKDWAIVKAEPYLHLDYLNHTKHLIACWCELAGVEDDGDGPELFVSKHELALAKVIMPDCEVLFQPWGGMAPKDKTEMSMLQSYGMYKRSLSPQAAGDMVDNWKNVYVVCAETHPEIQGTTKLTQGLRILFACIKLAPKIVCIDSFVQHAAKALDKQATVLWGGTDEKVLGYEFHDNRRLDNCTPCHRPNSYLGDMEWDCPYDSKCMDFKDI